MNETPDSIGRRSRDTRPLPDGGRHPTVRWGVKLVRGNVGFANKVLTLPQWCAFPLPRPVADEDVRSGRAFRT